MIRVSSGKKKSGLAASMDDVVFGVWMKKPTVDKDRFLPLL